MSFDPKILFPNVDFEKYEKMVKQLGLVPFSWYVGETIGIKTKEGKFFSLASLDILYVNRGYSTVRIFKASQVLAKYNLRNCPCGQEINANDCKWQNSDEGLSEISIVCPKCQKEIFFGYGEKIETIMEFMDQLVYLLEKRETDAKWKEMKE